MTSTDKAPSADVIAARRRWFADYLRQRDQNPAASEALAGGRFPCPCCYCRTLEEHGSYDICMVCFWEDDGQDDRDAELVRGGPNGTLSLAQARENYARFGACNERFQHDVRLPTAEEDPAS